MAAIKLPMICRSLVGGMRRNDILVPWQYECARIWRRGFHGLPQDGSVSYLQNSVNGAEVYLVGTNHISEKSAQLVKQVVGFVNPNIIAVELCIRRAESLQQPQSKHPSILKLFSNSWEVPGSPHMKLVHFSLHFLYHNLRVIGFEPGKEFKIALEECKRLEAQLLLIDEDIDVTTRNLGDALSFISLLRIIKKKMGLKELAANMEREDLIENVIENMTERNFARKAMEDLTSICPEI
ncbi:hypothetical protein KI387_020942, partial [Taxus chinensis]